LLAEAALLEAQAAVNDGYMRAMERTTERTGGRLGHLHSPCAYAAHQAAAARKRKRAAYLRVLAHNCKTHGEFSAIGCAILSDKLPLAAW
jgi:hypothetical protein